MTKRILINLGLLFMVSGLILITSCAKKSIISESANAQIVTPEEKLLTAEEIAKQKALKNKQRIREEELKQSTSKKRFQNQDIYFAYDSSELMPISQILLREKSAWLGKNSSINVIIEGHCDERGTTEYNLALGERRALAAKNFLIDLGISSSRLDTISYGEERPINTGKNSAGWAKNRRAHFVIK
ncbi:MAG: peptidoglycan-associated lipoprotein [Desulfobacteraceae bacterium 4572_130]|nr:MAG: peptidoglycan-associated lipoprotein [Desulfobacteraceae bacterium 4572_130]